MTIASKRALICAPCLPEFDRESGSRRLFDLINFLQEDGWTVSLVAERKDGGDRYIRLLRQRGIATYLGFTPSMERMIEASGFAVAILAFWSVAERLIPVLRQLSPSTRIIVDSVDLHFLRDARRVFHQVSVSPSPRGLEARYGSDVVRELNTYAAGDAVLTVSEKEAALINDLTADTNLAHVVPDAEAIRPSLVPPDERRGILFLGNFRHAPNVDAVEYFCGEILPWIAPDALELHPLFVVGNEPTEAVRRCVRDANHARLVGWVPSVIPYLHHARVCVIPLRFGAGTKRKLLQALMVGTPCVATNVGVEGLELTNGEQVLVADDPIGFAGGVERLLTDTELWQRLSDKGREHIGRTHDRQVAQARLRQVLASVFERPCKPMFALSGDPKQVYAKLVRRIGKIVADNLPADAMVAVASKGDDELLNFRGRRGVHFPQAKNGRYAGHYPADGREASEHVDRLRTKGCQYLLFPSTAFWWLDHYAELREHLDAHYQRVWSDADCIIYRLSRSDDTNGLARQRSPALSRDVIERLRPAVPHIPPPTAVNGAVTTRQVLALGIYLAFDQNNADDIVANLSTPGPFHVTQRWVALGGPAPSDRVSRVTARHVLEKTPKFQLINELVAAEDLAQYDYVVLFDDDIVLPDDFLNRFLSLQTRLGFSLAQPARTSNSYIDHPIVEQQQGVLARQTLFVEIGPVVSFHRSCFEFVFPFDLTSSMGWGYENVWAYELPRRNLSLGIIDALPVDHSLRKPVANYKWSVADAERSAYLRKNRHLTYEECFSILKVYGLEPV